MNIKQLVIEAKERIDSMTSDEIRATFIKHGYEPNKTKESCNTSHAENGQENYCSSEVK